MVNTVKIFSNRISIKLTGKDLFSLFVTFITSDEVCLVTGCINESSSKNYKIYEENRTPISL